MKHGNVAEWGGIKISSDVSVADGVITVTETYEEPMWGAKDRICRWMLDTRETKVRAGLIALGWTPPATTPR
jgi:hypothetical protein